MAYLKYSPHGGCIVHPKFILPKHQLGIVEDQSVYYSKKLLIGSSLKYKTIYIESPLLLPINTNWKMAYCDIIYLDETMELWCAKASGSAFSMEECKIVENNFYSVAIHTHGLGNGVYWINKAVDLEPPPEWAHT